MEDRKAALGTLIDGLDDNGYDVPFGTFTWARWEELQAETVQRFTRFQRAIARKDAEDALRIVTEMQEMTLVWLKEARSLVGDV